MMHLLLVNIQGWLDSMGHTKLTIFKLLEMFLIFAC